jgi:hypothetical protein
MLPLYGTATATRGFDPAEPRQVLRLRSLKEGPERPADVALVRHPDDFDKAASAGFISALLINDSTDALPRDNVLPRVVQVPSKFDYLYEGDILGFHLVSRRFRTLYRRTSAHNSFLVTDRCNHYCLMCS